jgi:transposase InsO family protein
MSKRRAVILAVTIEGLSQAEAARRYELSEPTVSRWLARYRAEGDTAFEARSRRPKTSPTAVPDDVTDRIVNLRVELVSQGLDAGPVTIAWHLERDGIEVSVSTIRRRLLAAGLVTPNPKKRPKSSFIRFEAELPNETWQSDFTHWRLSAPGPDAEIIVWLDDHSRYCLSLTAHRRVTGDDVVTTFLETGATEGFPASTLTDNGLVYTTRRLPGDGRNRFETTLTELGITQKNSRPNHPTTCGKVERFHQSLKRWLTQQPRPATLTELQTQLERFRHIYNHERPHRALAGRTPTIVYNLLPKTGPTGTNTGPHHRLRHDRVDKTGAVSLRRAGRMHHISIGRAHAGTPVILLIDDLDIRVINTTTGELLRHLTLDPTRGYQPRHKKR